MCIFALLQPNIMHWPLLLLSRDGVEGSAGGTASGIEAAAIGVAAAADGKLASVNFLDVLLLLPLRATIAAGVEDCHKEEGPDHHPSFENHEWDFFVSKFTVKAVGEFGDTEAGTDQD